MVEEMTEQEPKVLLGAKIWELIHLCDKIQKDTPAEGMGEDKNHILWFVQRLRRVELGLLEELHTGRRTVGMLTSCPDGETKGVVDIFQTLLPLFRQWLLVAIEGAVEDHDSRLVASRPDSLVLLSKHLRG
jgi:hypothetical protein